MYDLIHRIIELRQPLNPSRKAKGLAERKDELIKKIGEFILKELQLLCHWAKKYLPLGLFTNACHMRKTSSIHHDR